MAGCDTVPGLGRSRAVPPGPPPVAMGPWLLEPAAGRVTVAFTTQKPSVGRVWYGTREPDRLASETGAPALEHRVVLGALQPATRYRYRVEGEAATAWFESAPAAEAEGPIRVLVHGDDGGSNGDHALVARAAASEGAQLVLHTGGMVAAPREDRLWRAWFREENDLLAHAPIVAAPAGDGAAFARYFQRLGMPAYGSIDYGPLHICVLDSSEGNGGISEAQRAWFEEDLRGVGRDRHVWVLVHQGPSPQNAQDGGSGSDSLQAALQGAGRIHSIEALFAGNRFYDRGTAGNVRWFVLGTGAAPDRAAASVLSYAVLSVCGCHSRGVVKNIAGKVLDSFELSDCAVPCAAEEALPVAAAAPAPPAVEPADAGPSGTHRRRRRSRGGLDGGAAPAENRPR